MSTPNIKDYISKALALEKAVFIQEELLKEYTKLLNVKRCSLEKSLPHLPIKPVKRTVIKSHVEKRNVNPEDYTVEEPIPPQKPKLDTKSLHSCLFWGIFCLVGSIFFFVMGFIYEEAFQCIFGGITCLCISFFSFKDVYLDYSLYRFALKVAYPDKLKKYEDEKKRYPELVEREKQRYNADVARQERIYTDNLKAAETKYKKELEKADTEHRIALDRYSDEMKRYTQLKKSLDDFDNSSATILQDQTYLLEQLKLALNRHYNTNVLYPKYQYFVAVASISEYLSSGRCDTLVGANGAYNIYESELRQNLVISQLSSILGNIDQAKQNQYLLYNELMDAKNSVKKLSCSIDSDPFDKNNTTLSSYIQKTLMLIEN